MRQNGRMRQFAEEIVQSPKLSSVRYDVRGPIAQEAARLERVPKLATVAVARP